MESRRTGYNAAAVRAAACTRILALLLCLVSVLAAVTQTGWAAYSSVTGAWSGTWTPTGADAERKVRAKLFYQVTETATTYKIEVYGQECFYRDNVSTTIYGTLKLTGCTAQNGSKSYTYKSGGTNNTDKYYTICSGLSKTFTKTHAAQTASASMKAYKAKGGGASSEKSSTASKSFTIPAKASYAVTYNANGGSGAPAGQTKWYGENLTLQAGRPVRNGFTFMGWNTRADGAGVNYSPGQVYTGNAALALYAKWAQNPKVSFNANGGTLAAAHGADIMIASDGRIMQNGSVLQLVTPATPISLTNANGVNLEKPGYHVPAGAEWSNSAEYGKGQTFAAGRQYTAAQLSTDVLYANWVPNTYTVRFFPNGDDENPVTGVMPDQHLRVDHTEKIQSNSFIRPGFRLAGWDFDPAADPSGPLTVAGDKGSVLNLTRDFSKVVQLYAIWKPIEETQADINVGKIVKSNARIDAYTFRIEPVEGWRHENESTLASGQHIDEAEMPMPEGTPETDDPDEDGSAGAPAGYKDVEVTGLAGNEGVVRSGSMGLLTFEDPGWYMYRISEVIPSPPEEGVTYDRTSYYVVIYVDYKEDMGSKVKVYGTTAWHNSRGSGRNRPDLRDIAEVTDNGGAPPVANEEGVYGKTGAGTNSILVRFWNDQNPAGEEDPQLTGLRVSKNVTGSLGDITKKFRFTASFTGLAANTTYSILNDDAELVSGFTGSSFTTDAAGRAQLSFRLKDDAGIAVEGLPLNSRVDVTEGQSDHDPSYAVYTDDGSLVKEDGLPGHGELSTGEITLKDAGGMYSVEFTNSRDIAENTGVTERGIPAAIAVMIMLTALAVILVGKIVKSNMHKKENI